jgi:flagellar biosynthesis/type III secretory pathway M-ring protein FliF/YscJ
MRRLATFAESIVGLFGLLILLMVGALLLYAGNRARELTLSDLGNMVSAKGVVVDVTASRDTEDDGLVYSPVIEFQPETASAPVRFEQSIRQSENLAAKRGDTVEVLYDPENPQNARVNSFVDLWVLPIVLIGSGAIVLLIALGVLLRTVVRLGRGQDTGIDIDL